ncbi:sugar ABC transporter ATP-binding protein [Pseudomonas sp. SDO524_S393]
MLRLENIEKQFPGVKALGGVRLTVGNAEVHALLGENGAGKSTLLKILAGAQRADAGTILLDGAEHVFASPIEAQRAGIATIYQEFTLFPMLTVAENIYSGREPKRRGLVDYGAMRKGACEVIERLGLAIDPDRLVSQLTVGEQQLVEIGRALSMSARLIIMDEPTAALSIREIQRLHTIIRDLKAAGISVIIVTHRLNEVFEVCDRYTILRDGGFIEDGNVCETDEDTLIKRMVGREKSSLFSREKSAVTGPVVFEVRGLCSQGVARTASIRLQNINLHVRAGEIVGFAGLVGAGRTDVARAVFGANPNVTGQIFVAGEEVSIRSPGDAMKHGIALVPEDRKQQGIFPELSCAKNLSVCVLKDLSRLGIVNEKQEALLAERYIKALRVKLASQHQPIKLLSGGNQQKLLLSRWMAVQPRVLIVDEPTRGIDISAKADVHRLLAEMALKGIAVIVISSELPEVIGISDRIYTFCEGQVTGELKGAALNEEAVMQLMTPTVLTKQRIAVGGH